MLHLWKHSTQKNLLRIIEKRIFPELQYAIFEHFGGALEQCLAFCYH